MFRFTQVCQKALGIILCLLFVFGAASAHAQTQSYHVYIDTDLDDTTGCSVSLTNTGGSQTFPGFEYRLSVSVIGTTVSATTLSTCSGSTFGGFVALGSSHPLAITDIGTAVTDHIELGLPLASLTVPGSSVRLVIGTNGDFIATVAPMGGPILMPLAFSGGEPHGIPLLPPVALALLGIAVGFIGWRSQRRQHILSACLCVIAAGSLLSISLAWAAGRITFDGNLTGWSGIPVLASGNTGDHTGSVDLLKLYAAIDDDQLKLRIDANSGRPSTQPPIPAPIPGDPLDARLPTLSVTGVQHLAINQPWVLNLTAKDSNGTIIPVTVHPNSAHPTDINVSGANPLTFNWTPNNNHIGQHIVTVTATDSNGKTITHDLILAVTNPADLPVNPETIAPPLVPGSTPFQEGTEFIYTGQDPIQKGVAEGTIQAERAAILRGFVRDRNDQPLAGVTVTILDHPEYGATKTRADGWFDLGVNGGGILVLDYQKPGYLRAQRKVDVPWRDYAIAEDVVLITLDAKATPITLNNAEWQAAIGSETDDGRGKRTHVVFFPPHTTANLTFSDGTQKPLDHFTFRATEYTIGDNGFEAMPGELPSSVGYTYAVELSADEAIASGARHVEFNQNVIAYLDNFLGFPVGVVVPYGVYDYEQATWVGGENGRILKILAIQHGKAVVQVAKEARAATAAELTALGITEDELAVLAKTYVAGKTLWRIPTRQFSAKDYNWPLGVGDNATGSPPKGGNGGGCGDGISCDSCPGCEVYADRSLGQRIPVPGSPFDLAYRSDRAWQTAYTIPLTASGEPVPAELVSIKAKVDIAGRHFEHIPQKGVDGFTPGLTWYFEWDGKDAYGRTVQNGAKANIEVSLFYPVVRYESYEEYLSAFSDLQIRSNNGGSGGGGGGSGNSSSGVTMASGTVELTAVVRRWQAHLLTVSPEVALSNAGGWALGGLKYYDAANRRLYTGGGQMRTADSQPATFRRVAELTGRIYSGAAAPDGGLYLSEPATHSIVHLDRDGNLRRIAGGNGAGRSGDGGPAIHAQLSQPEAVAISRESTLFFTQSSGRYLRKIDAQGNIHTVAGNGDSGLSNQRGPALATPLYAFNSLAADRDGNVLFNAQGKLHQVSVNGLLTDATVYQSDIGAGNSLISDVTADPAGGYWFVRDKRIYRLMSGGDTFLRAGGGSLVEDGEALSLDIDPSQLQADRHGGVYFYDGPLKSYRHLDASGYVSTVTRTDTLLRVRYFFGADGLLWRLTGDNVIDVMEIALPGQEGVHRIPRENGILIDVFDKYGRHIEVRNGITDALVVSIDYGGTPESGYPVQITDADGNQVRFERSSQGQLAAIVGVDGERTELSHNGNMLTLATAPGGISHRMRYHSDPRLAGLLTAYTDPNGHEDRFEYDNDALLKRNINPAGGGWRLASEENKDTRTDILTSALGKSIRYTRPRSGNQRWQEIVTPDGLKTTGTNGYSVGGNNWSIAYPDGSQASGSRQADPRHGMAASTQSLLFRLGSHGNEGLSLWIDTQRNLGEHGEWSETTSRYSRYDGSVDVSTTSWRYGNLSYATSKRHVWSAYVDDLMRVHEIYPNGLAPISYTYDSRGRTTEIRSDGDAGSGQQTRSYALGYDGNGKLASVTDPLGQTSGYQYDAVGRLVSATLPGGRSLGYQYDANGNLTSLTTPAGITHSFHYNAINQATDYEAPTSATVWTYNLDRQLTRIERPGQTLDLTYDLGGRLKKLATPEGDTTWTYNNKGQLDRVANNNVTLDYSRTGTLTTGTTWSGEINGKFSVTPDTKRWLLPSSPTIEAGGERFSFMLSLTVEGRVYAMGNYSGNLLNLGYGEHGLLTGLDAGKYATGWQYNDFGETTSVGHSGPVAPYSPPSMEAMRSVFLAKAAALKGELLSEIERLDTCQIKGWPRPLSRSMYTDWENIEDLSEEDIAERTARLGPPQYRAPDYCLEYIGNIADGLMNRARLADFIWAQWVETDLISLHTNASGGAAGIAGLNDATSFITPQAQTLLDELEAIRLKIVAGLPDQGFVADYRYERDELGRITKQTAVVLGERSEHEYKYDPAGRLIEHIQNGQSTTWGYDANGNRITENGAVIASYDAEDRMSAFKGVNYTYNAAGDLTSKGTASYTYDSLGNLKTVRLANGDSIEYLIDPANRRVGKKKNGQLQYGLLYQNALRPIAQLKPDGKIRAIFYYTGESNAPSAMIMDGRMYRFVTDHLGSVRGVIDTTDGTLKQAIDYDVWGKVTRDTNPGFQPFGFAGGLYDPDTGLTRFGARDYDAEAGRWTAKDPILFDGGDVNLYGYVANDPVNYFDPFGLWRLADIFPSDAPIVTIGEAFGAMAAYLQGLISGNDALTNEALSGLSENQNRNAEALILLGTMGRGKHCPTAFSKGGPPRAPSGNYLPHPDAVGPHTTLGTRQGREGAYTQGAVFDGKGNFVGRVDVTNHGRPSQHSNPHFHPATGPGGTGPAGPLPW